ncbi:eukaryotic translation initiation factor 5 [Hyperolius riggenbachi]|uniref:eukaryotic translation initiation factor 5 n=1 Tax=Hyperolius riggenbachi TaxID=752182 RepID=UPI0035A3BEEA
MSVNVNRSVSDQFYRYKMPRLIAKVEGKGNGIKTVIVNMVDVAKALNRPPTYPTKFFGCELGAQTQFDVKNDRYIVNGSHEANKLQDMLDGFIKKFVLCPECDNPETDLHVNPKKQTIGNSCKACGYRGMLDTNHKLCTFILKNPPENTDSSTGKKKEDKKSKRTKENGSVANNESQVLTDLNPPRVDTSQGYQEVAESRFWEETQQSMSHMQKTKAGYTFFFFFQFCHNNKKAQRYLLHGFECVVSIHQAQLVSKIPHILKEMYDADLLEEEVIFSWAEKPSKKYVSKELAKEIRTKAEPFIKWLKEAEEESSGEEEDEEDENIEVVYSTTVSVPKVETVKSKVEKEDDIDIDAI